MDGSVSSSPLAANATKDDELKYYKRQYEILEAELSEFQASSKDLEAELERDVEAAEKRERTLKQKVETLTYEVDEWKTKCKQAKTESSSAQTSLQKEITALRESNRTLQLRLRDIEVANDDYERQARHTTSSLEDMEIKYNSAIEKAVLLEAEMKAGEKEREELRIEAQRVRSELADLHVEAEIQQTKLRRAEEVAAKASKTAAVRRPGTPTSETIASSPTVATPQTGSLSSMTSETQTPPSPITSDKAKLSPARIAGTSAAPNGMQTIPYITRLNRSTTTVRPTRPLSDEKRDPIATASSSLAQIRGLIGKMQKLEQKVQNVRAKMPATNTPPRAISKTGGTIGSSLINGTVPSSITVRSGRRGRTGGSILSGETLSTADDASTPSATPSGPPRYSIGVQGIPVPSRLSTANADARSVTSSKSQPTSQFQPLRPTSRISIHSHASRQSLSHISSMTNMNGYATMQPQTQRPQSRASINQGTGRTTPSLSRARSSIGGHNLQNGTMLPPAPLFNTTSNRPRRSSILPSANSNIFYSAEPEQEDSQTTPTQTSEYTATKTAIPTPVPARRKTGRDSLVGAYPMPLFSGANAKRKSGFGFSASSTGAGTRKSGVSGPNANGDVSPGKVEDDGMGETY